MLLQYVAVGYHVVLQLCAVPNRSASSQGFGAGTGGCLLDEKYYTSLVSYPWVASFLDPSYEDLGFAPEVEPTDRVLKRDLVADVRSWSKRLMRDKLLN